MIKLEKPKIFMPSKTADLGNSMWNLFLVGAGGTGSHLLSHLARLMSYKNLASQRIESLTVVDGDLVEAKNVGRQLFVTEDIGKNKAVVLANRYNYAYGLEISALPNMLDESTIGEKGAVIPQGGLRNPTMIIGSVDNHKARKAIFKSAKKLSKDRSAVYWVDCGNGYDKGQVVWGNTSSRKKIKNTNGAFFEYLPYPPIVFPELLKPAAVPMLNCDDAIVAEEQGPNINAQMGLLAVEMIRNILEGRMTTSLVAVDYEFLQVSSQSVTQEWLNQV